MRDEIAKRIAALLALPGMNKTLLTYLAGINRNALESYDSAEWNPTIQTLDRLMKVVEALEKIAEG